MKKIKLAILLGNRGFFPGSVIATAREEMCEAVTRAGAEVLCMDSFLTRYGAIETREEGAFKALRGTRRKALSTARFSGRGEN